MTKEIHLIIAHLRLALYHAEINNLTTALNEVKIAYEELKDETKS